jgi:hypothetical protein
MDGRIKRDFAGNTHVAVVETCIAYLIVRQRADQVEQTVAAARDVRAVLDVAVRPIAFRGSIVALVEERVEGFENELQAKRSQHEGRHHRERVNWGECVGLGQGLPRTICGHSHSRVAIS